MKTSNKLFSFLLAMLMCLGTLYVPAYAVYIGEPAVTVPDPVFTLDLSSYTQENQVIKNGMDTSETSQNVANIKLPTSTTLNNPGTGPALTTYYSTKDGTEVNALMMGANKKLVGGNWTGSYYGYVELPADTMTELFADGQEGYSASNNGEEMTITFWAKRVGVLNDQRVLRYNGVVDIYGNAATTLNIRPYGGSSGTSVYPAENTWEFYAFSQKWDEATKTWEMSFRKNDGTGVGGKQSGTKTLNDGRADMSAAGLYIGGYKEGGDNIFSGEIAGFKIYNTKMTDTEFASIYNDEKVLYGNLLEDSLWEPTLAPKSASAINVEPSAGTFEIEFNNHIAPDSVEGSIILMEEDGITEVEGVSAEADGNKLVVTHGTLKDGMMYRLFILSTLKAIREDITASPQEIVINSVEKTDIVTLDLNEYDLGDFPTDEGWTCNSSGTINNSTDIRVEEKSSSIDPTKKIKYLKISGTNQKETYFSYALPDEYKNGNVVIDMKIYADGTPGGGSRSLRFGSGSAAFDMSSNGAPNATRDEFGFANLRGIAEKADGKYTVKWYDKLNANALLSTTTVNVTSIGSFFFQEWLGNVTAETTSFINIAEFRAVPYVFAEGEGTDTASLTKKSDEFAVRFDKRMNTDSFRNGKFVLKDVTDAEKPKTIKTEFISYEPGYREAKIKLCEYLTNRHTYELTFSGINCEYDLPASTVPLSFTTNFGGAGAGDPAFKSASGTVLESLEGVTNAKVEIAITSIPTGGSVSAFLVLTDENGRLIDFAEATITTNGTLAPALSGGYTPKPGYKLKCYVWEKTGGMHSALSSVAAVISYPISSTDE